MALGDVINIVDWALVQSGTIKMGLWMKVTTGWQFKESYDLEQKKRSCSRCTVYKDSWDMVDRLCHRKEEWTLKTFLAIGFHGHQRWALNIERWTSDPITNDHWSLNDTPKDLLDAKLLILHWLQKEDLALNFPMVPGIEIHTTYIVAIQLRRCRVNSDINSHQHSKR